MYARRPFSGSSSSNTGSGSSTDTRAPTGNLKKTLYKTFEGQKFVVKSAAGWIMRNQLSDVMYSGGRYKDCSRDQELRESAGRRVDTLNFAGKPKEWTRTFYNSDYSTSRADISRLIMR
jgi:hypothetical protein